MIYETEVVKLIELANNEGLKMLMVGGGAVNFHGYQRHSADVDFWFEPSEENTKKLLTVLQKMDFDLDDIPDKVLKGEQNISIKISPLQSIELISRFNPNKTFEEAWKESIETTISGHDIARYRVLSYADLITSKIKAGRPKDFLDIQELKRVKDAS